MQSGNILYLHSQGDEGAFGRTAHQGVAPDYCIIAHTASLRNFRHQKKCHTMIPEQLCISSISAQTHLHNLADGGVGEAMHRLSIHQNLAGIVVPDSSDLLKKPNQVKN